MPPAESLAAFAKTGALLGIHLSVHVLREVCEELSAHYGAGCPAAVIYRATWPDQKVYRAPLDQIADAVDSSVERTAIILVGHTLGAEQFDESRLYSTDYNRRFRSFSAKKVDEAAHHD